MQKNIQILPFLDQALDKSIADYLLQLSLQKTISENETAIVNKIAKIERRILQIKTRQRSDLDFLSKKIDDLKYELCKRLEDNSKNIDESNAIHKNLISIATESSREDVASSHQDFDKKSNNFIEPVTGMEFVWVPGGSFEMGNVFGQGHPDERPTYTATVEDFWIGKYPVTQNQWKIIMNNNPSHFQGNSNNRPRKRTILLQSYLIEIFIYL